MSNLIQAERIGKLGFGYMRLPQKDGKDDIEQIIRMADAFIKSGGTYFDTAYTYDNSEVSLRESVIKRYPRDSVQIATKLYLRLASNIKQVDEQFRTSLDRLGTDYIDFYLLHGINAELSKNAEDLGVWLYLAELKEKGQIRHIGFSFHSSAEELDEILSKHPETDIVQLQINYSDWENQSINSRGLYETARKHHKPIVVMEPLKGGLLTSEASPIAELLHNANPDVSMASWALRYTAELEGVLVTLSGMSTFEQVADNIAIFTDIKPLSADEHAVLAKAVGIFNSVPRIECTSCRYCVRDCPAKISIPSLIGIYNNYLIHNPLNNLSRSYMIWTKNAGRARDCTACRVCEDSCPQHIEIVDALAKISGIFDS